MLRSVLCPTLLFATSFVLVIVVLVPHTLGLSWSWTSSRIGTISSSSLPHSVLHLNRSLIPASETAFLPSFKASPLLINGNDFSWPSVQKRQRAGMNLRKVFSGKIKRPKERDAKLEKLEAGLARARALIRDNMVNQSHSSPLEDADYVPQGDIYMNPYAFHRSYLLMESLFKIFVYEEGEPPIFHNGPCKSIYSLEGVFINLLEMNSHFRTHDPDEAHVYFLPFSVVMMKHLLFDRLAHNKGFLKHAVRGYVNTISTNYPYWNRSLGADHFMLSCHDWGPRVTKYVPQLYLSSIRVLCNANSSENFNPKKDASLPEINLKTGELEGLTGGFPPSNRTVLAFFAGGAHGSIRLALFQHWKEKDEDVRVYEKLPQSMSYNGMMKKSKYCICPSGWEVASPRIVEAIYAECVPVLISQHYVLPFSDVLNWDAFSIQVSVSDIPNLRKILMGIPQDQYIRMQERLKHVQRHFLVNDPPKRFDVFHMVIHSIWLRRMNVLVHS